MELICNTGAFTGTGTSPAFNNSPTLTKTLTPQTYALQSINIGNLCPGTLYQFRAREVESISPTTTSAWTSTFTFTTPGVFISPTISLTSTNTATCANPNSQLNVTINSSCGGGAATYTWAPAAGLSSTSIANPIATPSSTTTYTCIVNGDPYTGCWSTSSTVTVGVGNPPVLASLNSTPSCNSATNGTATVAVSTGASPYTYSWSAIAQTGSTVTGLAGGSTYTVTVTDASGCTVTSAILVPQLAAVTFTLTGTNASCGLSNGSISATAVAGGSGSAYSYSWSSSASTGATETGQTAGAYTLTVTDGAGCSGTSSTTLISNPGVVAAITAQTNLTCNGNSSGSVTASATAGSMAYTYSWSNNASAVTNATSNTINGLPAVGYTLTITDGGGCTSTTSATLTEPPAISATAGSTTSLCGASNGSVNVSVSGGAGGFTYIWSNGPTAATVSGLAANGYTVTVTDQNGCTSTTAATVGNSGSVSASMNAGTNVKCKGGSDGSASVTAAGTSSPYTYSWSNGASTTTSSTSDGIMNLTINTYSVTVTDGNGCVSSTNVTITSPPALVTGGTSTTASCGKSNGAISVSVTGGAGTYSYLWNNGLTAAGATGVGANGYTVTVTDGNGCTSVTNVTVANAGGATVTMNAPVNIKCNGGMDGSASVIAAGTSLPFTYSWSNGTTSVTSSTSNGISNIPANTYTVMVTDATGCFNVTSVTLTQPTKLGLTGTGLSTKCKASCDGQGVVIPSGGTIPYTVSWGSAGTGLSVGNLCAGTFAMTIMDANGCTKDSSVQVLEPTAVVVLAMSTPADCNQSNGSVSATASGGTVGTGYNFVWTGGVTGQTAGSIGAGNYIVTVTDNNGCTGTATTTVLNNNGVNASILNTSATTCFAACDGSATANPTGGAGPYKYVWTGASTGQTAGNLCQGNYTVTITDNNNCTSSAIAMVAQPKALALAPIAPLTTCIGQSVNLTAVPSGGTPVYSVTWQPGAQTGTTINVMLTQSTTYTISAVDANGCTTTTQTAVVNVNPPLNVAITAVNPVCPGTNVNLTSNVSGGDGNYSYTWMTTPNASTANVTVKPLSQQIYTLVVSDNCGSPPATATVQVDVNPEPKIIFTSDVTEGCPVLCVNFADQSTISSGTIIQWLWNFGDSTSTLQKPPSCFETPGKYTIHLSAVSDKGCRATDSIIDMITVYPKPVAEFSTNPIVATITDPEIKFKDLSTNAINWAWDFGDPLDNKTSILQNPVHAYSDTGTFCTFLTVVSAQSCFDTITHCLIVTPEFDFFVPNAFSPNHDGKNDKFSGKGYGIKKYDMLIFDRWGNLLFTTSDLNNGWDGKANGGSETAQQDIYIYKITILDVFQYTHSYTGHVSLIR